MPRRCPSIAGSRRSFAQRRLPSMMIAMWRGTLRRSITGGAPAASEMLTDDTPRNRRRSPRRHPPHPQADGREARVVFRNRSTRRRERSFACEYGARAARAAPQPRARAPNPRSHLHNLFLFGRDEPVDLLDVSIRKLLKRFLHPLVVVFGDIVRLQLPFEFVVSPVANVADRHPAVLGLLLDELGKLATALFVERRDCQA